MKIQPPARATEPTQPANKTAAAPPAAPAAPAENRAPGRDFASVLENLSQNPKREEKHEEKRGEDAGAVRREAKARPEVKHESEREVSRRDAEHGLGVSAQPGRLVTDDATPAGEAVTARGVLHLNDLEKIVSAVRTQVLAGGRREVTIELQRSVLEGLRVKLSADGVGRVTAEFVAASEKVRAEVAARASDLADLMRSRGVNLSELKTVVGGHASGGRERDGRDDSGGQETDAVAPHAGPSTAAASESPEVPSDDYTDGIGDYRA